MAGTATYTERAFGSVKLIKCAWTSDASGVVSGTASSKVYDGQVLELVTVPSATAAPTDLYDLTVLDDNSLDALAGTGANRSATNTEYVVASLGTVASSKLTITIAAAGAAKQGTVYIWVR